jgi:hypothetical protein
MRAHLIFLALCSACLDPTEIELIVTTDVPCDQVARTQILFGDAVVSSSMACSPGGRIGSLILVPSNRGLSGNVTVEMELKGGACPTTNCIVARRTLTFVSHQKLSVDIALTQSCTGVACDATATCVNGICMSPMVIGDQ